MPTFSLLSHRARWRAVAVSLPLLAGCSSRAKSSGMSGTSSDGPVLQRITPDTIRVRRGGPNAVVLMGRGFDAAVNTVDIGPVRLTRVPATAKGRRIDLWLPETVPSGGGAAPGPWTAGRYPVTVTTPRGQSDALVVVVVP